MGLDDQNIKTRLPRKIIPNDRIKTSASNCGIALQYHMEDEGTLLSVPYINMGIMKTDKPVRCP